MSMIVNTALGALIFGYAAWTVIRFVKKSKKGKCAGCAIEHSCSSACGSIAEK